MHVLKGVYIYLIYIRKIDLNSIPKLFLVFSLIAKFTNIVKIAKFSGYPFLFFCITKMSFIINSDAS